MVCLINEFFNLREGVMSRTIKYKKKYKGLESKLIVHGKKTFGKRKRWKHEKSSADEKDLFDSLKGRKITS
jgi:hypothetical protein